MDYVKIVAPSLYLLVNVLFVLKYGLRAGTVAGLVATALYFSVAAFLLWRLMKSPMMMKNGPGAEERALSGGNHSKKAEKASLVGEWRDVLESGRQWKACALLLVVGLVGLLLGQLMIDPWSLNVDRWSAIHNFLSHLFQGIYPYSARTHLGGYGSPFPVWQLVHVPFYLLGDVGLSLFASFLFLIYALQKVQGVRGALVSGLLLLFSPGFAYEALVRSDLVSNFMVVSAVVALLVGRHKTIKADGLLFGILIGLLLSTRLSTGVVWMVLLLRPFLRLDVARQLRFVLVVAAVFALTFVPFSFWDGNMLFFFTYNPFVLQTRQGSPLVLLVFIPVVVALALTWGGSWRRFSTHAAMALVALVVTTFVVNMAATCTWDELFQSRYDITYFNMSLPFLAIAMGACHCGADVRIS